MIPVYFEGPLISIVVVDRSNIGDNFEMGESRAQPEIALKGEGATTANSASTSTSKMIGAFTSPP